MFGDRIVAVYCKDFIIEDGKKKQVPVGIGIFNYKLLFNLLKKQKPHPYVLIEDVIDIETLDESKKFLLEIYKRN